MKMPRNIGPVHFIGIGGIGMSGIAEILHNQGYTVQGSDASANPNVQRLRDMGIKVEIGQSGDNLGAAEVVVVSSAIKRDNPELVAARARQLPIVRRAEMLAEIMRFKTAIAIGGTHGKTTTTTLVAALLDAGNLDPTVINGGIINAYGTNARLGAGEWMVVEADESDGTFVKLPADVAVVTNIDPEHLDHYGSFEGVQKAFHQFVENVPFYGFAVMCLDHPEVQALVGEIKDRRVITYGQNPQADVRLVDLETIDGVSHFSIEIRDRIRMTQLRIDGLELPMPGVHNALNATAAIAVADQLHVPAEAIRTGLKGFTGVKRRFTRTGVVGGVTIIDDYGHHPVEITAALKAARESTRRDVIAVVQPHRYSRLKDLFDDFSACFNDADTVIVAPVYAAGEQPIEGVTHEELVNRILSRGHRDARVIDRPEALAPLLASRVADGDYVVCLGAGNITQWAATLPGELAALMSEEVK
ncbi:UDP-N-acetylmuramate--L-alanine ligase [Devosia sp. J2-20]|jgi:UDP-N-acetylmuramate--alanine ligase|uniref:UDP-N-acetylmuramate--L-alanine ligase n=1 Tax=Devosia TaxID=46913 RepID=UPI0022B052FE|nr:MULTISPECIES: UDP-N-acetylmuramate--L-alanine ligase [Devosia]MCZ4345778.1 UDP-N-acetylmuramate--L-alanine ligase [Devosia neptuniae]WDQ99086.1 UDP-N-acetylmuramate--L-alanine ligase [Devosia sp. J2-20]|tara:strand:+ start:79430 stop:80848 length:1419 start_codon:yes stop_codon:yes gene_type:complete